MATSNSYLSTTLKRLSPFGQSFQNKGQSQESQQSFDTKGLTNPFTQSFYQSKIPQQQEVSQSSLGQEQVSDINKQLGESQPLRTTGGVELRDLGGGQVSAVGSKTTPTLESPTAPGGSTSSILKSLGLSDLGQSAEDLQFKQLQQQLLQSLMDQQSQLPSQASISDQFALRKQQAEQAAEGAKSLIESQFQEAETGAKQLGEQQKTALQESRRGFATNTAVLRQLEDTNTKRIRDLEKQRDEKLAMNDIQSAERLDNLIFQEQESITKARTDYISNTFQTLGALQSIRSFETPEQQRKRNLLSDIQKEQFLEELGLGQYAESEAVSELKSVDGVGLVSVNPDGSYQVVVPSGTGGQVAENILKIRTSVRQEPQFKDFSGILNGYQNVKIGVAQDDAAGDLAIVNGIAKMLDPTGVVRPAEFDTVEEAQGWLEKQANLFFKVKEGRIVGQGAMTRFMDLADNLINTKANPIKDNLISTYAPVALGMGVELAQAVPEIAQLETLLQSIGQGNSNSGTPQSKGQLSDRDFVEQILTGQGLSYQSVVDNAQKGEIPVINNSTGQVGYITVEEFNNSTYTRI